jgi:hypothetical protein
MPTAPAPTAFTTGPQVKQYLRIPVTNTDDDGLLRSLADVANMAIAKSLLRNVLSASYTETRNGTGTPTLMLLNTPVTAVASVSIVGPLAQPNVIPPPVSLIQGVDYAVTPYSLKLYNGRWPRGIANVIVEYTAGYASIPADLGHVAAKVAALRYRELERLGQKSKIIAQENITFDLSEFPPDVEGILDRYRTGMGISDELAGTQ